MAKVSLRLQVTDALIGAAEPLIQEHEWEILGCWIVANHKMRESSK
jgi:hypothetical protein